MKLRTARKGGFLEIDMSFSARRRDTIAVQDGNSFSIDKVAVLIIEDLSGTKARGHRELRIRDQQVGDAFDGAVDVERYVVEVLSRYDRIFTHRVR